MREPYAELLEFNQPSPVRKKGYTRIREAYDGLRVWTGGDMSVRYRDPERIVEFAGRADYGPKNTAKLGSDPTIISRWIDSGHHSMLEFACATFYIECSRVVSHELVRHRLASFQQESQRYVKYDDLSADDLFIPDFGEQTWDVAGKVYREYEQALAAYKILRNAGIKAQVARYVLPNGMPVRMVMKANLREWRHILNLRTAKAAQPEMQKLAWQIHEQLVDVFPNIMYNAIGQEEVR